MAKSTLYDKVARGHISLKQASPMLGISYGTAVKLAAKGAIRVIKVGGVTKVTIDEIERFLAQGNFVLSDQNIPPAADPGIKIPVEPPAPVHGIIGNLDGSDYPDYLKTFVKEQGNDSQSS